MDGLYLIDINWVNTICDMFEPPGNIGTTTSSGPETTEPLGSHSVPRDDRFYIVDFQLHRKPEPTTSNQSYHCVLKPLPLPLSVSNIQ